MRKQSILLYVLLLAMPITAAAQEDPCSFDGNLQDYLTDLSERLSSPVPEKATELQLAGRANSDGLAGGRLDLLRRAFVALDLGEVKEEEGKLVFNFNPEALKLDPLGQLSPRITVFEPVLFASLDEQSDAAKEALKKELGDLDDVELRLRWTPQRARPDDAIERAANEIFEDAYTQSAQLAARELAERGAKFSQQLQEILGPEPSVAERQVAEICANDRAAAQLTQLAADLQSAVPELIERLGTQLAGTPFFQIADLIDGQPRLTAEGAYRRREGATGPNEVTVNARFEVGAVSLWGFRSWARRRDLAEDTTSVTQYLNEKGRLEDYLPKFSLTAEYTKISDVEIAIPDQADPFSQPGSRKLSADLQTGWYFGGGRDRRLELVATYDDVSDDPSQQDRFVGTLSWVETLGADLAQIAGGSELVVSFVWANKPEFRGEVDEDFGLRAGLKWSLGPKPGAGN